MCPTSPSAVLAAVAVSAAVLAALVLTGCGSSASGGPATLNLRRSS
jgi:hypothetical protein